MEYLDLPGIVESACCDLISTCDATVIALGDSIAQIVSDRITLQFSYDQRQSREIGISIFRSKYPDQVLQLGDVLRNPYSEHDGLGKFLVNVHRDNVQSTIELIGAQLLLEFGRLLRGDEDVFRGLYDDQKERSAEYTARIELEAVYESANVAWRNAEYSRFVQIVGRFRDILSPTDSRKLAYAERACDTGDTG